MVSKVKTQIKKKSKYISQFKPEARKISDIIGPYNTKVVVIPKFQREYRWKKEQIEDFVIDIYEFYENGYSISQHSTYFMGPIVTKDFENSTFILDGQQRLATSIIFLAAIRDILLEKDWTPPVKGKAIIQADKIQSEFIEKNSDGDPVFSLVLGEIDKLYFRDQIQRKNGQKTLLRKAMLTSHESIRVAHRTIKSALNNYICAFAKDEDQLKLLVGLRDALVIGTKVIAIEVEEDWSAYKIFETLNDRGLKLSVSDLLLNYLISCAKNQQSRSSIRTKWDTMLKDLRSKDLSNFFRYSWISRNGDLKSQNLYHELTSQIQENKLVPEDFVNDCVNDLKEYHNILDDSERSLPKTLKTYMHGVIKHYGATRAIPLLMAIRRSLNVSNQMAAAKLVNKLVFRYSIIMDLNTSKLESILYSAAKTIHSNEKLGLNQRDIYSELVMDLEKEMPKDADVKAKLKDFDYNDNNVALWTLMQIELQQNKNFKNNDLDIISLEHIFPEKPDKKAWPNHSRMEKLTYKIGNFALLTESDNSLVGNKSILLKAPYFHNIINTINPPKNTSTWDEADINKRTVSLNKKIIEVL